MFLRFPGKAYLGHAATELGVKADRLIQLVCSALSLPEEPEKPKDPSDSPQSPEARLRRKLLAAIDLQISAAQAEANGEEFVRQAMRWTTDKDTGEKVRQEVPIRMRRWWWNDDTARISLLGGVDRQGQCRTLGACPSAHDPFSGAGGACR